VDIFYPSFSKKSQAVYVSTHLRVYKIGLLRSSETAAEVAGMSFACLFSQSSGLIMVRWSSPVHLHRATNLFGRIETAGIGVILVI